MSTSSNTEPNRPANSRKQISRDVWLAIAYGFPLLLVFLSLWPPGHANPAVSVTLQITAALLLLWFLGLLIGQKKGQPALTVTFAPLAPHYVQAAVQICIYVYWGWYWRPVYDHSGLIVAQLVLAYGLDMLLSLTRRRTWALGFGPFPIILSTNLFLLFKPDWFYFQFAMVALGILGKEFIRWNRDGKNTHIFNPSAFSLFVFSIALIVTDTTTWSFAEEIATTLNRAPHIYLQIFLLGLVVQYLFSVTMVTLVSVLALVSLNLAYTGVTGTYFFIDSNIPIAVFLGLHLLITDPATSPRTALGKAIFGGLYGAGVFLLYGFLGWLGVPTFYDKLLCVPVLNLMVPWIDTLARRLRPALIDQGPTYSEISPKANRIHMLVWSAVFTVMLAMNFVGPGHRGNSTEFWANACDEGLRNGCQTLFDINRNNCQSGDAEACLRAGEVFQSRPSVSNRLEEGHLLSRGCDLGHQPACDSFRDYIVDGGKTDLETACADNDLTSCFIIGLVELFGVGTPVNVPSALENWKRACEGGWARACGYLGETYLLGKKTEANPEAAALYLGEACTLEYPSACTTLAIMYQRGHGVPENKDIAEQLLRDACDADWQLACDRIEGSR